MGRALAIVALAVLLIGCATAAPTPDRPAASPTIATTSEMKPELEKYSDGQPGTFVLYHLKRDHVLRYNSDRAAQRFLPASTFKILNSLISLVTGVIPDENTVIIGLAPLSVLPEYQRQGIGTALMKAGLAECARLGYERVIVLGHPNYYPRFGFMRASQHGIRCEWEAPDEAFMVLELQHGALDSVSGLARYQPEWNGV